MKIWSIPRSKHKYMYCTQLVLNHFLFYTIIDFWFRSTHDHDRKDRVKYWLTDTEGGGQPIPDKVFMVMSYPK